MEIGTLFWSSMLLFLQFFPVQPAVYFLGPYRLSQHTPSGFPFHWLLRLSLCWIFLLIFLCRFHLSVSSLVRAINPLSVSASLLFAIPVSPLLNTAFDAAVVPVCVQAGFPQLSYLLLGIYLFHVVDLLFYIFNARQNFSCLSSNAFALYVVFPLLTPCHPIHWPIS